MNNNNKLLIDLNGLNTFKDRIEQKIPDISYSNGQFTKTINGTATPIASATLIVSDGGGGGSISGLMVETTYANLVTLRNNSQLVPGQQYRITDYECVTIQAETKSAFHPFDIIVIADSINTLNESARAIAHNNDVYFLNCKLEAWELKYCLDNDATRFTWALADNVSAIRVNGRDYPRYAAGDTAVDGTTYYAWGWANNDIVYTLTDTPVVNDRAIIDIETIQGYYIEAIPTGRGVIYQMKDEYNNILPYDFKNIMYRRYKQADTTARWNRGYLAFRDNNNIPNITLGDINDFLWSYTFYSTYVTTTAANVVLDDKSLNGGAYNVIYIGYNSELPDLILGNTRNTIFGNGCYRLTATAIINSRLGDKCHDCFFYVLNYATIGSQLYRSNIQMSSTVYGLIIQHYCSLLWLETIGGGLGNIFENRCSNIHIENNSSYNTFKLGCSNISLGSGSNYNIFGPYSKNITGGKNCRTNTFNNSCYLITIPNYCYCLEFNDVMYTTLDKEYLYRSRFNNCYYLTYTSALTTSSSNVILNVLINNIRGTSANPITISHDTLNDEHITTYQPANSQIISI